MSKCSPYEVGTLLPEEIVSKTNRLPNPYPTADTSILSTNPSATYNRAQIVEATRRFNAILKATDLSQYPLLRARMNNTGHQFADYIGPFTSAPNITYAEVSEFLNEYNYTFGDFENAINNPSLEDGSPFETLLQNYNDSLSANNGCSIPSGLFSAVGNMFGQVRELVGQLNQGFDLLQGILRNFEQLIEGGIFGAINTLVQGIIDQLMSQIGALFQQITSLFQCLLGGYLQQLNNMANLAAQAFTDLPQLASSAINRIGLGMRQLQNFYSETNFENLRVDAERFLQTSLDQFEQLTPEIIDFVGQRFTRFAEQAQAYMDAPMQNFRTLMDRVYSEYRAIDAHSLQNTAAMANAGGVVIQPDQLNEIRARLVESANAFRNRQNGEGAIT